MNLFYLEPLKEKKLEEAINFVELQEENSIELMSRLLDGSWQKEIYSYYLVYEGEPILKKNLVAVIMHSKGGLVQHCIKNPSAYFENRMFYWSLRSLFERQNLYCIMGEKTGTELLQDIAKKFAPEKTISENREYLLLLYNPENLPDELLNPQFDFEIVRCSEDDKERIFPLQKQYDIVEVLPEGKAFSAEVCKRVLSINLKNQVIYAIKQDGKLVAKAGTNAIGKNYVQFGGVFTDENYRGQGMAQCLVSKLSKEFTEQGKKCALFVKVKNEKAKKAYRKAGYTYQNDYIICYYGTDF